MTSTTTGGRATALALSGLPSVGRELALHSRALARLVARIGRKRTVVVGAAGPVTVGLVGLEAAVPMGDAPPFAIYFDGHAGRLFVDPEAAVALVSAVLGARRPITSRPLGRSERGVLASLIAGFVHGLSAGAGFQIALVRAADRSRTPPPGSCIDLLLSIRAPGLTGFARVEFPIRALSTAPSAVLVRDPEGERATYVGAVATLARTTLPAAAVAGASAGDAVIFDGCPALAPETSWAVSLRVGAYVAPAHFDPDGTLNVTGIFVNSREDTHSMSTHIADDDANDPSAKQNLSEVLAAAPVEVTAELGRITLRGDEVLGLSPGAVLRLGDRGQRDIELRAGGRLWAKGELVTVDDELAVRLTEIIR